MIKKLQKKFIAIAMGVTVMVMALIITAINLINYVQMNNKTDNLLSIITENDGSFPAMKKEQHESENKNRDPSNGLFNFQVTAETPFETRYFSARANGDYTVTKLDTGHVASLSSDEALTFINTVLSEGKTSGYLNHYKYLVTPTEYGYLVVFLDCHSELNSFLSILFISVAIGVIACLVIFLLVAVLSHKAVQPVIKNVEKQKQFITDASHEIKTPLAIISANTEVLEMIGGENEWLASIKNQTRRLDDLVKRLLMLSKMEEEKVETVFLPVSLSDIAWEAASAFEPLAANAGYPMELHIPQDIRIEADASSIRELVTILIDNAVKYNEPGGAITVSLQRSGKTVHLAVWNKNTQLTEEELDRLFDRFYRAEKSRSREGGGYGIGLSIALAVVTTHKGKISVKRNGDLIGFEVILPSL